MLYRYVIDRWYARLLAPPATGLLPPETEREQCDLTHMKLTKKISKTNSLPIHTEPVTHRAPPTEHTRPEADADLSTRLGSVHESSALQLRVVKRGSVTSFTLYLTTRSGKTQKAT